MSRSPVPPELPPDLPVAGMQLRGATAADCPALAVLARSAHAYPWSERQYRDSLDANHAVWLLETVAGELVAGCVISQLFDEAEILDVAVAPGWRRRGIAAALLQRLIQALPAGTGRVLLEVRASNTAARALYAGLGFAEDGVRRNYYPAHDGGREDAVLLSLDL